MLDKRPRHFSLLFSCTLVHVSFPSGSLLGCPFSRVACYRISVSNSDPGHDLRQCFTARTGSTLERRRQWGTFPLARSSHVLCRGVLCIRRNGRAVIMPDSASTQRIYHFDVSHDERSRVVEVLRREIVELFDKYRSADGGNIRGNARQILRRARHFPG